MIEKIRKSRDKFAVILMKYNQDFAINKYNNIYCFFEGEDAKFYYNRIQNYFSKELSVFDFKGKENVLRMKEHLDSQEDIYLETYFFVDRDYTNDVSQDNLYVTPVHSIENFYVSPETFDNILKIEFKLQATSDLFKRIKNFYLKSLFEFIKQFKIVNDFFLYDEEAKTGISYENLKTLKKMYTIEGYSFEVYEDFACKFTEELIENGISFDHEDYLDEKYSLNIENVRGKNIFKFQVDFLKNIIAEINKNHSKYNCDKIKLNITNNALSELTHAINMPKCLENFLSK